MTLPFFKKPDKNSEEENNSIIASSSRLSKLSGLDLTNFDMLRALANDYTSVYYTNLETGESAVVSFDDRNMREVAVVYDENVLQLDDFSRQYANKRVPPSHYQDFVEVVSLANLRVKMAENPVFKYRFIAYKGDKENHFLMKACRINDSKTHIIVGFSDIEAQVAYEKERSIEFESVNNIKGEFLKNTSHELMTPLNAINGFTEIAIKEKDPEKIKDYLEHIHSETQGLIIQIRNLISMSEFSLINRPPCYQAYALSDLFNAMKDRMKAPAEAKNITFTTDESGIKVNKILTDIEFTNRIMIHLLYNAIKYTNNGGTVIMSVKQEMIDEQTVANEFHIKDNGIGMSKEFSKHLFEVFAREQTTTEGAPSGLGLGLAITEKLVQSLDGSISVVTKKDFGSDFKVILPTKVPK